MNINISVETEAALKELAALNGQDVSDYAGALLEREVKAKKVNNDDDDDKDPFALDRAIERMKNRTPEEIESAQTQAIREYKPERPLPEGKTIFDVICGKWPGDETDEEIAEALRKLS
jgi:hypothetical protein